MSTRIDKYEELIQQQKAEIETLKAERNNYKEWYLSLANEVDKLPCKTVVGNNSEIHSKSAKDYDNLIASIKSEAIQDFAERLKGKADKCCWQTNYYVNTTDIDNLAKEMTEGKENA